MQISFEGRRALVTGAANGIGRAIAHELAQSGAQVVAVDILARELEGAGAHPSGRISTAACDLTRRADTQALARDYGPFDIFVHSAGGVCGQVGRPLEEVPEEDWDAIVAINQKAPFLLAQALAPSMKERRYGRMVFISSGAGLGVSLTGIQAYASAKAGEIGLTRQLAHELGPFGITVNSVAPGFVRSNPTTERQWASYGAEGQKALLNRIATRRLGTAEDIANAVAFLASEQAGWITGQTLSVDGGK
ncbi:short-chain dehydrogenase [Alsobacter soli]|uniref:Short-chain dehydrogenase n=1 Tax=Alsobacter soli TaxID=2109933 RepID=A0A2T1HMH0_9HYPH|nr:SDR family NAD(P)-dependent oxidoreductase [Alsobacter soli]PSC02828.1 short-chain dehydrogenase [Alsobacter soli]